MKKIVFSAFFAAMTVSLIFAAPKKSNRTELKIWESKGPESAFIQAAIKEYKAINPKVKIYYEQCESTETRNKIELDGPAGVGADIFVAPHDHIGALVAGQHILPIDDQDYLKDFYPLAQKAATFDGVEYGYPLGAETYVLYYNKDIIEKAPQTWDEIISLAKDWNKKVENLYEIAWPVNDAYFAFMFTESFGAPLFGPNGDDPKQHNVNDPRTIEGLSYMQMLRKQILDIPAMDASRDFCHASFSEGKSPLIITGSWKTNEFKTLKINYGVSTLPRFPGKSNPATSFSGVRLAFVSSYTEYPEEAKEFAKFLTSKEMLEKRYKLTDQIPPRNDIEILDDDVVQIKKQLAYSKVMPTIHQSGTYWRVMGSAISGIWDGDDVKKTMDIAAKQMDVAK